MSEQKCTECNGSGVGSANSGTQQEFEDSGFSYEPLECQHCGGSGIEP
ncbi:hypothetical protein WOC08_23355 [Vibrio parahaemolyticus]|nr:MULTISPECIES: hypothetical protein [Vibrio]AEX22266.1 hypothetical protein VEJY3_08890 [Vibrio sp. EJY3]EID4382624.1 hypothetical protein [Vibrio parahaemolyticus]MBE3853579.1 hypothetical protein [Vibrio parahaemolyticus]MBM4891805.1 hypothetical protein [Vibrio parahaemolyticus]MDF4995332.1 hypothetical protein [Vibrio parahaemolyticus]